MTGSSTGPVTSLFRWFSQVELPEADRVPSRGSTRLDMARVAFAPLQQTLSPEQLDRLTNAVAMVFGTEAMA
ncbi:hypothetical protein ACFQZZ_26260 [Nocardia sp. GCM10030253]|uniref:hypothetical protein n=1 Tax=Nocardia sp. GCM10030253 TaxID=3273404 RepID=UPI003631BE4B